MYENRDKGIQGYSHKDIRGCKDTGIHGRGYKKGRMQGYSETRKHRENVTGYRKMRSRNIGK